MTGALLLARQGAGSIVPGRLAAARPGGPPGVEAPAVGEAAHRTQKGIARQCNTPVGAGKTAAGGALGELWGSSPGVKPGMGSAVAKGAGPLSLVPSTSARQYSAGRR